MKKHKKMNKNLKQNKGITLIALVVTIIVLLILAGISIVMLTGQTGILTQAQQAREKTEDSTESESVQLAVARALTDGLGELTTENLQEAIAEEFGESKRNNLTGEGPWKFKGERGTYNIGIAGSVEEDKEKDLTNVDKKVTDLKVGDYIKYDTGVEEVGENGTALFRVFYPLDSEYGLQIISDEGLEQIAMGGETQEEAKEAYNGAIKKLNQTAEKYINPTYASDARCLGSLPTISSDGKFTEKYHENTNNFTMNDFIYDGKLDEDIAAVFQTTDGLFYPNENITIAEGAEDELEGYYGVDENSYLDSLQVKKINELSHLIDINNAIEASRGCNPNGVYEECDVGLESGTSMRLGWEGHGFFSLLCDADENNVITKVSLYAARSIEGSFYPCVALKYNNIKITEGDGSEGNPYIISVK